MCFSGPLRSAARPMMGTCPVLRLFRMVSMRAAVSMVPLYMLSPGRCVTSPELRVHRRACRACFRRFCRLSARIVVVDPGLAVDWWCWDTTDPPPGPDPPR
jgi:hypothetical protein